MKGRISPHLGSSLRAEEKFDQLSAKCTKCELSWPSNQSTAERTDALIRFNGIFRPLTQPLKKSDGLLGIPSVTLSMAKKIGSFGTGVFSGSGPKQDKVESKFQPMVRLWHGPSSSFTRVLKHQCIACGRF
eukprot:Gregarina_sp_Poly_1__6862@NODE_3718_length_913_cov_30_651300_g2382_i0_p1_GENE_NODE_3718_length_913_cov_30_651300_g2382_i0NODE_3718_length_913_cov_30_651300_g2382_i0_p1_ORF_typecomplete_len131_score8_44_NODE_3718_length_913_cov_30_651300_g2382_i0115507